MIEIKLTYKLIGAQILLEEIWGTTITNILYVDNSL